MASRRAPARSVALPLPINHLLLPPESPLPSSLVSPLATPQKPHALSPLCPSPRRRAGERGAHPPTVPVHRRRRSGGTPRLIQSRQIRLCFSPRRGAIPPRPGELPFLPDPMRTVRFRGGLGGLARRSGRLGPLLGPIWAFQPSPALDSMRAQPSLLGVRPPRPEFSEIARVCVVLVPDLRLRVRSPLCMALRGWATDY